MVIRSTPLIQEILRPLIFRDHWLSMQIRCLNTHTKSAPSDIKAGYMLGLRQISGISS